MKIYKATIHTDNPGPKNLIICASSWNEAWDLALEKSPSIHNYLSLEQAENLSTQLTEATIIVEF